jgi:hypothetical protein
LTLQGDLIREDGTRIVQGTDVVHISVHIGLHRHSGRGAGRHMGSPAFGRHFIDVASASISRREAMELAMQFVSAEAVSGMMPAASMGCFLDR